MLNHSTLRPKASSRSHPKRVGRGSSSGKGVFCGRGCKGQKARTGNGKIHPLFEGGQTPLHMRLPKLRGGNDSLKTIYSVIHLSDLESLALAGTTTITLEVLRESGLVRGNKPLVKILSGGEVSASVQVSVHAASETARLAIEKSGGTLTILK